MPFSYSSGEPNNKMFFFNTSSLNNQKGLSYFCKQRVTLLNDQN